MRRLAATALLLIAGVVTAAEPEPGVYLPPEDTRCWTCHAPGVDDPDMDPSYEAFLHAGDVRRGEVFEMRFGLLNVWLGGMLDVTASLDLAGTGLELAGEPLPVRTQVVRGEVPTQAPPEPGSAPRLPPRSDSVAATIPEGSTAVRVALVPDDRDPVTGPDLVLAVQPERGATSHRADEAGAGGTEVVSFSDLNAMLEAGYGEWMFHVTPAGDIDVHPAPAPYRIEIAAWTNTTGRTQAILTTAGPVQPGAQALLSAPVVLTGTPQPDARVRLAVNATYHWPHTDCVDCPDDGYFHVPFAFPVTAEADHVVFGTSGGATVAPVVQGVSLARISEAVGYVSGSLLLVSLVTGGVLGKASRRRLNVVFGSARRRVACHNFISYGLTAAAVAHLVLFLVEIDWHWAHGLMWGGASLLGMLGLGLTGAMQVPLIRRWNHATWRRVHLSLAVVTLATAGGHMLLDGANFGWVQEALGYDDPFVPEA